MAPDVSRFTSCSSPLLPLFHSSPHPTNSLLDIAAISSMFGKATSKLSSSSRKSETPDEEEGERDEESADRGPAYRNASGGIGNSQSGAADVSTVEKVSL